MSVCLSFVLCLLFFCFLILICFVFFCFFRVIIVTHYFDFFYIPKVSIDSIFDHLFSSANVLFKVSDFAIL